MKEYIIILDQSTMSTHIYYKYIDDSIEIEDKIRNLGHKPSECSWMITNELKLKIE